MSIKKQLSVHLITTMIKIEKLYNTRFYYFTNHPSKTPRALSLDSLDFEELDNNHFRLKENISASSALMHLFDEGQHIIDCVVALELCQYYAILNMFIDNLGETEGQNRFDLLFGSADTSTNSQRRMMFSAFPALASSNSAMLTEESVFRNSVKYINPLFYFLDFIPEVKRGKRILSDDISEGLFASVSGHPKYSEKHIVGLHICQNVLSVGNKKFLGFGNGIEPVSMDEIKQFLVDGYNEPCLYNASATLQCTIEDIKGFESGSIYGFIEESLLIALRLPQISIQIMEKYQINSNAVFFKPQLTSVDSIREELISLCQGKKKYASLIAAVNSNQFDLALRKAAADLNLPLMDCLLKFKRELNLNVNSRSTNGATALDWVDKFEVTSSMIQDRKNSARMLLIKQGAKTKLELDYQFMQGSSSSLS